MTPMIDINYGSWKMTKFENIADGVFYEEETNTKSKDIAYDTCYQSSSRVKQTNSKDLVDNTIYPVIE